MVGWVLFRAETFGQAMQFLGNMSGLAAGSAPAQKLARYWSNELVWSLVLGAVFSMPAWGWLRSPGWGVSEGRVPTTFGRGRPGAGLALECYWSSRCY